MCRWNVSVEVGNGMADKEKRIKVLHVLKSSIYSGAENIVITIIKNLKEEYDFLYLATDGAIRTKLEQEHIQCVLLNKFSRHDLKKVIQDWRPDIVHAHDFSATVLCATMREHFQLISHLHYDPPWVQKWNIKTYIYLIAARRISEILTVSKKSYDNMVFANCLGKKQLTVGNPVDAERIRAMGEEAICQEKYDLIFVGRFVEQKNPERFINIVKLLRDKHIQVNCVMLGCGELEGNCRKQIQAYGLEKQIKLLGFQSNPYPFIKAASLLCMTSDWEGYGLVLLEANILGVPVLSSRTSGSEEVLGESAEELCDKDMDFVEKISILLKSKEEYMRWQRLSEQRVFALVTVDEYMHSISSIYQKRL